MKKPITLLLLTTTLVAAPVTIGKIANSPSLLAAESASKIKLKFSEMYRKETLRRSEDAGEEAVTTTNEVGRGALKLAVDLPMSKEKSATFDAATPFSIKLGGFEFGSTLGSDPQYAPGKTTATLIEAANSPSGNSRVILATAVLNWEREKMTIRLDADTPVGGKPVAAEDFLSSLPGKVKAETTAQIQIADHKIDLVVPFTGKVTRKTAGAGNAASEVVIVELKN